MVRNLLHGKRRQSTSVRVRPVTVEKPAGCMWSQIRNPQQGPRCDVLSKNGIERPDEGVVVKGGPHQGLG